MNQVFRDALLELQRSPGLASNLTSANGVAFSQTSLDAGTLRMAIQDDVVVTHVEVGLPLGRRPVGHPRGHQLSR